MTNAPLLDLGIYAGCWIALVRGRVVASGESAHQTLLHCRAMRIKDEPILKFIPPVTHKKRRATRARRKSK